MTGPCGSHSNTLLQVLVHLSHDGVKLTFSVLGFCEGSDFQPNVSPQRLEKRNLSVLA